MDLSEADSRVDDGGPSSDLMVRRLGSRYLLVLAVAIGLVTVDQAILQPLIARLNWYAPAINLAGRQRMLSQRLCKAALALHAPASDGDRIASQEELRETLGQWTVAHAMLLGGSEELGVERIRSPEIDREWSTLSPHFNAMRGAAKHLLSEGIASEPDGVSAATTAINDHEVAFLNSMERIVKLMEQEADAAIFRLRRFAALIAFAIIVCLLTLGWWVLRPATSTIRRQVADLESRVAARTRDLSSTLESLRQEMTRREQADIKTQQLAAQLAHASRVWTMGHLTSGLAHEVNQPLATISNYVEACDVELERLPEAAQSERLRNYLELAKQAALRAGAIVRRMRSFVRPNSSQTAEVELDTLIREVVALCQAEAEAAETEIRLDLQDCRVRVSVDSVQVQQVLVNLVQNAIHSMCCSALEPRRITITSAEVSNAIQVDVEDTGPGFATEDPNAVFAPFYTTKRDGLGIGLAISREIVESHGGSIWAEASHDGGAKVSFTLPTNKTNVRSSGLRYECVCS